MGSRKNESGKQLKPTFSSVTDTLCVCGYLERASEEPEVPIVFDAKVNEYHIANIGKNGGHRVIYHCPWCGGAAPRSKRASLFATVTDKRRAASERWCKAS